MNMKKMNMKKRVTALLLTFVVLLGLGASYGAVKNEIKAVVSTISATYNKKTEKLNTLVYNNEIYVPMKKVAALLGKNVAFSSANSKVAISDPAVKVNHPIAVMTMSTGETVEIELYTEEAPVTVANFKFLANRGFYDGLTFHRVIDKFMIQGGDPEGNGTGGPGYNIKGEFMKNGVVNTILHEKGVISMARAADYNTGGSQFFIMLGTENSLNGDYAAFGKVTKGIEIVEKIGKVAVDANSKPTTDQVIKTIRVK